MTLKAKLLEGQLCPVSCGAQGKSLPPLGCPVPSCQVSIKDPELCTWWVCWEGQMRQQREQRALGEVNQMQGVCAEQAPGIHSCLHKRGL